ncbi:MAG TPA: helix-turn-helix domain-containing protein [Chitinophagales bacterium]|nr:helix-turn-helix domain-containing protein [Chitinophagales bacterium]HNA14765.1 helix-turn-helix domain-containing protein [Cyclobacteriaceae bacterium]HNC13939.1 helix-turn-helix domain-containing protein [Cyclobacteriaceae bacterium]
MQIEIDFLHSRENNAESEINLAKQADKLNKQCSQVLNILMTGEKLTSWSAMVNHHIGHLARRILDLKQKGYAIQDRWIEENGSRFKEYFIN